MHRSGELFHSLGDGLHARISISYWYFLNKMLWNLRLRSISHLVLLDSGVICCTASLLSPVKKEHIFPKAHDEAFKSSHPISNYCCICVLISLSLSYLPRGLAASNSRGHAEVIVRAVHSRTKRLMCACSYSLRKRYYRPLLYNAS